QQAQVVLGGASTRGRELLAAGAADLNAGLLADVTELDLDGGALKATRPVYAGKVLSTATSSGDAILATLRSRAFAAPEPNTSKSGEVISVSPVLTEDQIVTKIESFEE